MSNVIYRKIIRRILLGFYSIFFCCFLVLLFWKIERNIVLCCSAEKCRRWEPLITRVLG